MEEATVSVEGLLMRVVWRASTSADVCAAHHLSRLVIQCASPSFQASSSSSLFCRFRSRACPRSEGGCASRDLLDMLLLLMPFFLPLL